MALAKYSCDPMICATTVADDTPPRNSAESVPIAPACRSAQEAQEVVIDPRREPRRAAEHVGDDGRAVPLVGQGHQARQGGRVGALAGHGPAHGRHETQARPAPPGVQELGRIQDQRFQRLRVGLALGLKREGLAVGRCAGS